MTAPPRVRGLVSGHYLLEFDELDSTQLECQRRLKAGEKMLIGVRADYQTQGYGRRMTQWYAPPRQCLLVSYVIPLRTRTVDTPAVLAMAGSISVAQAIEWLTGLSPTLRWPNDVLLRSRKVAGVLVEVVRPGGVGLETSWAAIMGIGVNVNVQTWPLELSRTAISLREVTARPWSVEQVEIAIRSVIGGLPAQIAQWAPEDVLAQWRRRDVTPGMWFLAQTPEGSRLGKALAVTSKGTLLLQLQNGAEIEVTNARHAAGYEPPRTV